MENLYGIRDVGQGFDLFVAEVMVDALGVVQAAFNPCLFHHVEKGIRVFVHGDDFAVVGRRSHLEWFTLEIGKHMLAKDKGTLAPDQRNGDPREIRFLTRTL